MNELLNLLKDGHARTTLMLASELHTTPADIRRKLEFLENAGIIKRKIRMAEKERAAAPAASPARSL